MTRRNLFFTLLAGVACVVLLVLIDSGKIRTAVSRMSWSGGKVPLKPVPQEAIAASFDWSDHASVISAAKALEPALGRGDAVAQCEMASLVVYCSNLDGARNRLRILSGKGGGNGESGAGMIRRLAERERYCMGFEANFPEVFELFRKSALGGVHHAQNVFLSGTLFLRGEDADGESERRYVESAEEIALLAVDVGNRNAAFMLADAYAGRQESLGLAAVVKPDPEQALALYEKLSRDLDASSDPERGISRLVLDRRMSDLRIAHPGGLISTADSGVENTWDASTPTLNTSHISNPLGGIVGECQ